MTSNAIVPLTTESSVASVKLLASIVHALKDQVFQEGADFGVIPGTGTKPVLLLPGMEKLLRALRLRPEYIARQTVIDFDKPLFLFQYECRLIEVDTELVIATAIGSANSHEAKWRWREAQRVCPTCGKAAIIKGRAEYGGGWLCFAKKGGCGAKYSENDPAIVNQPVGRIENADIADQLNTIDKIAQKRALASAIKGAANVSELFTVDLDDMGEPPAAPPPAQTTITVTKPGLTGAEAKRMAAKYPKLSASDLATALGGPSAKWTDGFDAADQRIGEWAQAHAPSAAADVVDGEYTKESAS